MTQKRSTEKLFVSPSTGQPCDPCQYIAEIVCLRKSEKDGNALGYKFWNKSQKQLYQAQIVAARRLVDEFGYHAVLSYLNGPGKNVYSLGRYNPLKFVHEGVAKERVRIDQSNTNVEPVEDSGPILDTGVQKQFVKKNSLFSKIRKSQ